MKRLVLVAMMFFWPVSVWSQDRTGIIHDIVTQDILPGFGELQNQAGKLSAAAQSSCSGGDARQRFADAFLAWTSVSHLRFGPSEEDNRAFALAFWPDPRGKTAKALRRLLQDADFSILAPEVFREQSVAVRGFYALEYLLHDPDMSAPGSPAFHCALIQAIARDILATSEELNQAWQSYVPTLENPGPDTPYRTQDEVIQVLFKSASTGLQFTAEKRLGRPLGTFDRPRPRRAEAWRSGLSLDLTTRAVESSGFLALRLAAEDEKLQERLDYMILSFLKRAEKLDDPSFAEVSAPRGRIRVEALLEVLNSIRGIVDRDLGAQLDVVSGFNALDGD